jgi:hypothetical protein
MPLEFARLGKQRCEVRSVKVDLRGFLDADQSAERGKKVDDTGGLVLDSSSGDSALPVKDAGDSMPAFELRSFLAAKFSVTLRSVAAVVGSVDNDGVL